MSVDISLISELFKTNNTEQSHALADVNRTDTVDVIGFPFDDETVIKRAENMGDAYERGSKEDRDKNADKTVSPEMLAKLADIVNADDFSMLEELGLAPDKDDPASLLTVAERIEIELAAHCKDYKPVGNISTKDIESLYGKTGLSYHVANELIKYNIEPNEKNVSEVLDAIDKIKGIGEISGQTAEYLLTNNRDITIDNVYMASHSVSNTEGKTFQKLSNEDWEELSSQAKTMLEQSGIEVDSDTLEDARWLIEEKIPLTKENIYKLSQIRQINEQQKSNSEIDDMKWAEKIVSDMAFLGTAGSSSMNFYHTVKGDSTEAVTIIQNGTEEQVESLMLDGCEVTLLNLKRYQENESRNAQKGREEREGRQLDKRKQQEIISAKRCLFEAKLKLTIQSGAMLIKNGVSLDISTLSETVERLREMENSLAEEIFRGIGYEADAEQTELFINTREYMRNFVKMPSYVLGDVYSEEIDFTITDISVEGAVKENILRSAQAAYDTLSTKPDRELGDSIKKAFAGISDMLMDMGLEDNEANRRAVRILSYNEMDIDIESIQSIKELDTQVSRLIDNLTPRTTAYLIANGINPLKTDIDELNDRLDEINKEIGADAAETYSEYLWKLEKNNKITKEDREAYLGIYRILHMIDKTDRSAVGAVIKQGGELTMRNLLTAMRSVKKKGMDIAVDDETGLTERIDMAENNIDNQLKSIESSVFYKRAKDILSPETVSRFLENEKESTDKPVGVMDMKLDEFVAYMSDMSYEAEQKMYRQNEELRSKDMENLRYISEETINQIMEDGLETHVENLLGMNYMMNCRGKLFSTIQSICADDETDKSIAGLSNEMELSEEEESMAKVSELPEKEEAVLKERIEKLAFDIKEAMLSKTEISIEDLRQVNRVVNYIKRAADKESYYVPMQLRNEQVLVRFTVKREEGKQKKAQIKIFGEEKTLVEAELRVKGGTVKIQDMTGMDEWQLKDIEAKLNEPAEGNSMVNLFHAAKQFIFAINNYVKQADI